MSSANWSRSILCAALVLGCQLVAAKVHGDDLRQRLQQAIELIEKSSAVSLQERECVMCHHQALPLITLGRARAAGFAIDAENFKAQQQRTIGHLTKGKANYLKGEGQGGDVDTAGFALWALADTGWPDDEVTAAVVEYLLQRSESSGHWECTSNRPPTEASDIRTTSLALYALNAYGSAYGSRAEDPRLKQRYASSRTWLAEAKVESTEDLVAKAYALTTLEMADGERQSLSDQLWSLQREDGGWAQLPTMESDAYATGIALVALHELLDVPVKDARYQRGANYLRSTQLPDGSWHVVSRSKPFQKYFESGFPHGKDQFISITASCWAVVALLPLIERCESELVFPLSQEHNHAPGIIESARGDLFVSFYRGSGERKADDVRVLGAFRKSGQSDWTAPIVLADRPEFPDCNTCLFIDRNERLWLFWPTVIANQWETCLTNYRSAKELPADGVPLWDREGYLLLRPDRLPEIANEQLAQLPPAEQLPEGLQKELVEMRQRIGDKLYQRLGWQPRCKPTQLPSGRILLPLYSDTYSMSLMAISDDNGTNWRASQPLPGLGCIQPTVLRRNDGTLVAYMRENGPNERVRTSQSTDDGETWSQVTNTELLNPGSGLDGVRLANGHWVLVYNDTTKGRNQLAVSLSEDEGATWKWTRHLEQHAEGSYHYPAIIQGRDGRIHVVYSYFVADGKSIKHAVFDEQWVRQ